MIIFAFFFTTMLIVAARFNIRIIVNITANIFVSFTVNILLFIFIDIFVAAEIYIGRSGCGLLTILGTLVRI